MMVVHLSVIPLPLLIKTVEGICKVGLIHHVQLQVLAEFRDYIMIALSHEAAISALEFGKSEFYRLRVSFDTTTAVQMLLNIGLAELAG